ncbi:uncharacterized protein AB675_8140 [Cyphellophora attinorum]|uniref:BTB domain-containing protein n=1 Tax=Cyphellophora attinorum TaxID=1664694 RepID=A0A0N0NNB1_9EURO|nr:uncharacterized protein AB675_8140 [Phialophora attinorum]KPI41318.1 hypothetical protein AB675_8140 [Phialophora attinorum]
MATTSQPEPAIEVHTGVESPTWSLNYIAEPPVKVVVGPAENAKSWYLPSGLLKSVSGYFRGCLNGNFAEAASGEVLLTKTDVRTFEYFLGWLLRRDELKTAPINDLEDTWILADRLLCEGLQNEAMDQVRARMHRANAIIQNPSPAVNNHRQKHADVTLRRLSRLSEMTNAGSELMKFWFANTAWNLTKHDTLFTNFTSSEDWKTFPDHLTKELFSEYHNCIVLGKDSASPAAPGGCSFHVHEGNKCDGSGGIKSDPDATQIVNSGDISSASAKRRKLSEVAVSDSGDPSTPTSTFTGFGGRGSGAVRGSIPRGGATPRAGSSSRGRGGFVPRGRGG